MERYHNFSPGPATLPESVVRELQQALYSFGPTHQGIAEMSHRGATFEAVMDSARQQVKSLLGLGDGHEVLFLHGGARTQFFQIPLNFLRGGRATYLDTGVWSDQAIIEARRYGEVDVPWSSKAQGYTSVPEAGAWGELPEGTRYLHYTSNNTVSGTEFSYVPDAGDAMLVCDASSDILSRPLDGTAFDLLYAGAQKNLGIAGTTLVVVSRRMLERADASADVPLMMRYGVHAAKGSMLNTPATFAIFAVERMLHWIGEQGGLQALAERNAAQADRLYGAIDGSSLFRAKVAPSSRSLMNVTFTTDDPDLDTRFVDEAEAAGLVGLKGHSLAGGMRASIYNAQTDAAVDALVGFMGEFESKHR